MTAGPATASGPLTRGYDGLCRHCIAEAEARSSVWPSAGPSCRHRPALSCPLGILQAHRSSFSNFAGSCNSRVCPRMRPRTSPESRLSPLGLSNMSDRRPDSSSPLPSRCYLVLAWAYRHPLNVLFQIDARCSRPSVLGAFRTHKARGRCRDMRDLCVGAPLAWADCPRLLRRSLGALAFPFRELPWCFHRASRTSARLALEGAKFLIYLGDYWLRG